MVDSSNIEIREEAEFEDQSVLSIKEIILRHLRKIGDISCQEFTGGYWDKKPMKTSSGILFTETYHPDIREMYCNAMDFLIDLIFPLGDNKLKEIIKEHNVSEFKDIKEKLKSKRKIFQEINIMFDRTNFWKSSNTVDE